jgi:hypothetical protein
MRHPILAAAAALVMPVAAQATVVGFDGYLSNFQDRRSFASQGLRFTDEAPFERFGIGVWTTAPLQNDLVTPNVWNGTPYLLAYDPFSFAAGNGAVFTIDSYQIALGWYQDVSPKEIGVTYLLAGGGSVSEVLTLANDAFLTVTPGLEVLRVRFTGIAETEGYVSLDNIAVTGVVPEPAAWAMLALGLAAVGAATRRRPARG